MRLQIGNLQKSPRQPNHRVNTKSKWARRPKRFPIPNRRLKKKSAPIGESAAAGTGETRVLRENMGRHVLDNPKIPLQAMRTRKIATNRLSSRRKKQRNTKSNRSPNGKSLPGRN
jgi:hypothetical protein